MQEDIFDEKPKKKSFFRKRKQKPKQRKVKKRKGSIAFLSSKRSEIKTAIFPEGTQYKEIEEKMRSMQFVPSEFDFKKVGETEGLEWYLGIACAASDAYGAGDTVVPAVYAKMWVALHMQEEEGYYLIIVSEQNTFHVAIGKRDILLYHIYKRSINNYNPKTFKAAVSDLIVQEFRRTTFPAVEIKKSLVVGNVPVQILSVLPNPVSVTAGPKEYSGSLNLSPKRHFRNRFTWDKFISSMPVIGREIVAVSVAFLFALSWAFPVNAGIAYVTNLYRDNNKKIIANITEIQQAKKQLLKVLQKLKDEQNLVESWYKAAQSIKPIDWVKFSQLIYSQNGVESFGVDKDKVIIVVRANSPDIIDVYIKKLIDSGHFQYFEAPERRAGSNVYLLRGTLK